VLTADIPSAGTMTARGAARMYAALLGHAGEAGLVSARRLASMAAITYRGMDQVAGIPTQSAFGYSPYRPGAPPAEGSAFGMPGANGSAAYADISTGVAVAIMRNRFTTGDFTAAANIGQLVSEAF
jgi:CubicO group peptidase (beta-lactamase class C family)